MKNLINVLIVILSFASSVYPQIGIAVAKDENNSAIIWLIKWDTGADPYEAAREGLQKKGYAYISTQPCDDCGHNLTDGFWVVIEAVSESDGNKRISFGLGANSISYHEAEMRAVENLREYDWNWDESDGYKITKKGTF